ncbi:hypothetical protein [uncultured Sphaerochaeta sp.]|uniref:hypothetical protein n=1 Tax=uncultured Sphaerochaeta sp. TaxID=886478 RepID=UPI0029CA9F00|nr:hypothetical protein [uncultured Sphaerochaeta sp.]
MDEKATLDHMILCFVDEIQSFHYSISALDHIWEIPFPDQNGSWHLIRVVSYRKHIALVDMSGKQGGYEFEDRSDIKPLEIPREYPDTKVWITYLNAARAWLQLVKKDWVAANKRIQREYPLELRQGIAPHAVIRSAFPDAYRLDEAIGLDKTKKIVDLVESLYFHKQADAEVKTFTANEYFAYCKIAYLAAKRDDEVIDASLSGRELYRQFADGRDEGLLKIDGDSPEEFADWIDNKHPLRSMGGHPWEIKRGGNTTHISLAVYRPMYREEGYVIQLSGESLGRMEETLRMLLAIHEAGLPITITNPESVRKRLLAQDNIGIIPEYVWFHRANQRFRKDEDVFEVMHYKELGRYKRRVTPFITWQPIPVLRPIGG